MAVKKNLEGMAPPIEVEPLRLWINQEWYIQVDNDGHCVGPCAEGALGSVVQILSDKNERHALKLPRLMGETHRENAYISDLMEKEVSAAHILMAGNSEGLLRAERWGPGGPLRGEINTAECRDEAARALDGSIVLVSFKVGKNPQFCLVKKNNAGVQHFPPAVDCPVTDDKTFTELKRLGETGFTVFIDLGGRCEAQHYQFTDQENKEEDQESNKEENNLLPLMFNKDQALNIKPTGRTWYTCIPSVAYSWAPGTLQEAISLNSRDVGGFAAYNGRLASDGPISVNEYQLMRVSQHFSLMKRLCKGLSRLHSKEMLHADLRPANIAYLDDPTDPGNYVLADYGSFAETGARPSGRNPAGGTVLGPVVGTERVSPFYAPERRAGREREAADMAIVLNPGDGDTLDIVLGWRSNLLDQETSTIPVPLDDIIRRFDETGDDPQSDSLLKQGDRIQIRDYIFDVIKAADIDDKQVLRCNRKCWKIYHGRIVIANDQDFRSLEYFPIPRTVELLQWSAATDLYSLGALSLYSVYRDESVYGDEQHPPDESTIKIEEDFREMIRYLENREYFNSIWPELEWFRQQLEENLRNNARISFDAFVELPFQRRDNLDSTNVNKGVDQPTTLLGEAIAIVGRLTQTVPGTYRLVKAFYFKLGPFIFFIHFVLCCLHRRNHVETIEDESLHFPFCKDRLEPPHADGGAKHALKRIRVVSSLLENANLAALDADSSIIPEFDPRPEQTIRVAMYNLRTEFAKIIGKAEDHVKKSKMGNREETIKQIAMLLSRAESALKNAG
jgi:serine/threonine protein kinase